MLKQISAMCWFLIMVFVAVALTGCGGGSSMTTSPGFTPTEHSGYAVYLLKETLNGDTSYVPQTGSDSFTVEVGAYKPVCLNQSQISAMSTGPIAQGGIDWHCTITRAVSSVPISPTENGWVLGPGQYDGLIDNPAGGKISFTVNVEPVDLGGLTVHMVAMDTSGKAFPKDADGHYQIPVWTTFDWVPIWFKNGLVVIQPDQYSVYAYPLTGSDNLTWVGPERQGRVVGITTFSVNVFDESDGGIGSVIDTVTIDFVPGSGIG